METERPNNSSGDRIGHPLDIFKTPRQISRILLTFAVLILTGELAGILVLLSHNDVRQVLFLVASMPLVLGAAYLIWLRKFEMAATFLAVVMLSLITLISTTGLGIHNISNLGIPAILILASLVIRPRTLVLLTLYAIVCAAWLVFGELYGIYTPQVLVKSVVGDFFSAVLILVITAVMVRMLTVALFQSNIAVQKELSQRKRAEERAAYDALHDTLTGLPNRTLLLDRLSLRLERARRRPDSLFAVLFIDLDRFKVINDSLGHAAGDALLIEAARRLSQSIRPDDTVSRLSGDEFALLLNEFNDSSDVIRVAERIQTRLAESSMVANFNHTTTASIGITVYNGTYTQPEEMLRDADTAMYRAKAQGGGHNQIFDESMYASAMALMRLEAELKRAVENHEWKVYYQPVVDLSTRQVVGFEALVRWDHPDRGICLPGEFIQVAEETGMILPIGEHVIREACQQLKDWRSGPLAGLWVSINLSARQFQDKRLVEKISQILQESDIPASRVQLEITESVAMKDIAYSTRILQELDQLGFRLSLDDFGTGYSSLGYLNRFPLKTLKIDRSFIPPGGGSQNNDTIRSAIISLGHKLNMEVIAEGVETETQLRLLVEDSCDMIQGHFFCKALPALELEALLGSAALQK